jgi:hypothetical protein
MVDRIGVSEPKRNRGKESCGLPHVAREDFVEGKTMTRLRPIAEHDGSLARIFRAMIQAQRAESA